MVVPGAVAPTTSSLVRSSARLCTGAVCQTKATYGSRLVLPSQISRVGSNCAPCCSSGAVGMPLIGTPIAVPSFGPDRVKLVGHDEPAGRRQVLHHDGRLTRDMRRHMTSDDAREQVVAAARRGADHQP